MSSYEVIVLFNGFSEINDTQTEMKANCTCTLIKGPMNIIVDTMTAWDGSKIQQALKSHKINPDKIDYVICTHGHSDHIGCNYLFKNATHIVGNSISKGERYILHDFSCGREYIIDDCIKVISTPGHTLSCVSVIVKTPNSTIAITGDLFERFEDITEENIWLEAGSENPEMQRKNRRRIFHLADYIVPGHGPMFKVTEDMKNNVLEYFSCIIS